MNSNDLWFEEEPPALYPSTNTHWHGCLLQKDAGGNTVQSHEIEIIYWSQGINRDGTAQTLLAVDDSELVQYLYSLPSLQHQGRIEHYENVTEVHGKADTVIFNCDPGQLQQAINDCHQNGVNYTIEFDRTTARPLESVKRRRSDTAFPATIRVSAEDLYKASQHLNLGIDAQNCEALLRHIHTQRGIGKRGQAH